MPQRREPCNTAPPDRSTATTNEPTRGDPPPAERKRSATPFERRSDALRENLRKRKRQARERAARAKAARVRGDEPPES